MTGLLVLSAALGFPPPEPAKLDLKDGDRIVWLGGSLVEREQKYGYWETALHAAFPKVSFTLRNLGWSGDTVYGDSRAAFDTPKEGFKRLVDQTLALKPTVIFISYGQNESFDGEARLPKFEKGLETLLDALKPANARLTVLMSPIPYEIGRIQSAKERNHVLEMYSQAIGGIAKKRDCLFVNTYDKVLGLYVVCDKMNGATRGEKDSWYTDNGIHLRSNGYDRTAHLLREALGLDDTHGSWGPDKLRQAIVAKNQLFFYRWRPQNETYLTGFRKHEQGRNAREVAEFDPLVDKAEKEIDRIKRE